MNSSLAGCRRIVAFVAFAMGPGISAAAQQPLQSQWTNTAAAAQTHSSGPDQTVSWAMSVLFDQLFSPRSEPGHERGRPAMWGAPEVFFAQSLTCAAVRVAWCNGSDAEAGDRIGAFAAAEYYAGLAWSWTRPLPFTGQSWSEPSPYTPGYFVWRWYQQSHEHEDVTSSVVAAPTWTKKTTAGAGTAIDSPHGQPAMGCTLGDASCTQSTPEPGTLALIGTGLASLGVWRRRRGRTGLARA
jgi:hypothetical protein